MAEFTTDTLHTACCLWEAALDAIADPASEFGETLRDYRGGHGTCALRQVVGELAPRCDAAWAALTYDEQFAAGCFDWEFAPDWLARNFAAAVRRAA